MKAIVYLLRKNLKNAIQDTIRHPLKFLLYLFIIISMVYGAVMGFVSSPGDSSVDDIFSMRLLKGAYLAILFFISIPILLNGLSSGTSFFSLSDVNNIFISPISPRLILIYGVGRRLATMLVLVITFSAYGGMVINLFDISVPQALLLIFGIVLMLIVVQLATLMIFCLASNHPTRAGIMKYIIYAVIFFTICTALYHLFSRGVTLNNFLDAISLPVLEYVPITGWLHGLIFAVMEGDMTKCIIFAALMLLTVVLSIVVLMKSKLDYYEDVLSGAESYHEFRESIREGKMSDKVMMGDKEIKLRKKGIKRGSGASTIFFKHMLEGSRRSRFIFFNINTFVLIFTALVIGFGIRSAIPGVDTTIIYLAAFIILAYVQFFFSASGDWVKELTKPYIYLIPDSAVKKLIMAAATGLIKPFTDGIITFLLLGIFIGGNPLDIIVCALTYGSFGCLYISSNILAQRIVGVDSSGGIFITFYMSVIVMTLLPGVIAGLIVLSLFAGSLGFIAATLLGAPILLWNLIISLIIFLTCRNLLDNTQ